MKLHFSLSVVIVVFFLDGMTVHSIFEEPSPKSINPRILQISTLPQRELLNRYCVTCHNENNKAQVNNLALDVLDPSNIAGSAESWEKVVRKLRSGFMPPPGSLRPGKTARDEFVKWLETELNYVSDKDPNPGRKDTFHRLNRTEYKNVIRDLLEIDVDVENLLPIDNPSYGFDNIAGTLTLNESLMYQYLSAAQTVVTAAVGSDESPVFKEFRSPYYFLQEERLDGAPLGTRGGLHVDYNFPQDGEYSIIVKLMCGSIVNAETSCSGAGGFIDPHELEVSIDGKRVDLITIKPKATATADDAKEAYSFRVPVTAGSHRVAAWFLKQPSVDEFDGVRSKFSKPMHRGNTVDLDWMAIFQPYIASVTVGGPFNASGPGDTPSRRRIFICEPNGVLDELNCAREILSTLARRAYRRHVSELEIEELLQFYKRGSARGFEAGIELALRRILTSSNFLFRMEIDPENVKPNINYQINDVELASRLSFFLWRSMPDDELLDIAIEGKLNNPDVIETQLNRMLQDNKTQRMIEDFAGQWLQLQKVDFVSPNAQMFPNFDESLKEDLRRETEIFVDNIRREDRSVMELLTADYSFLNERLAQHYKVLNVKGSRFRRVVFDKDNPRRGLLGQGSILTVTSSPIRTRPVVRGKWILENIFGAPPPAPPPNVPPLQETREALGLSMRERVSAHRENPACAGCHSVIDPLGFALENFNPVGQYRISDETFHSIDASGVLPDGTSFDGLVSFQASLAKNSEAFVTTLTEKMLTYALGRGIEYYDMPAVRKIVLASAGSDYRFSSIVSGVIKSLPFRMRRSETATVLTQ